MTTSYQLQAVNGSQVVPVADGSIRSYTVGLSFGVAPSAGTVTIETQDIGSATWVTVTRGEDVDVTSGQAAFSFDGAIRFVRVTFTGLVGGSMPILWVSSQAALIPLFDLLTDGGNGPARRLRVDSGQTGFFARRQWRLSFEFIDIDATPAVLRVTMPINFIIHLQALSVDAGGVALRAYRTGQGTPGGSFATPVPMYSVNFMDEMEAYVFQGDVDTGGTFTPSAPAVETIRVRTSGATAQQTTVSAAQTGERGLAADTYYLVISKLTGVSGGSSGVYTLIVEERP